jgi:hypothetical protein
MNSEKSLHFPYQLMRWVIKIFNWDTLGHFDTSLIYMDTNMIARMMAHIRYTGNGDRMPNLDGCVTIATFRPFPSVFGC